MQIKSLSATLFASVFFFGTTVVAQLPEPPKAKDTNPDPDIVEVTLIADEAKVDMNTGRMVEVCAFNGSVPGPTIEANKGNTLIVHLHNKLSTDLTIHWHGLELPANMDGSHISQLAVPPNGYFRYEFKVNVASTFWYHPHFKTNELIEKGLYGALIVRDPNEANLNLPALENLLILDDILLDEDGKIVAPFPSDPLLNAETQHNGRDGNYLLVNGKVRKRTYPVTNGVPIRMRLVNIANSRFMRLKLPGHTVYRIGGDQGLLESPIEVDSAMGLLLTPGERADVIFVPNGVKRFSMEWHDLRKGRHDAFYKPDNTIGLTHDHMDGMAPSQAMLNFEPTGPVSSGPLYVPPQNLSSINPIDTSNAPKIVSLFGHTPPDLAGNLTFFAQMKNGMPLPFIAMTPVDAPTVKVGDTVIWEVNNLTAGIHNFHLHGFKFQLIETQFIDMDNPANNYTVPASFRENKDTILIPRRTGARGRSRTITRLALEIDDEGREGQIEAFGKVPTDTHSGGCLFHCHILEHSARGMMGFLQVFDD